MADRVTALVSEVDRAERCAQEAADFAHQAVRLLDGIGGSAAEESSRVAVRADELADQVRGLRVRLEEVRGS